MEVVELNEFINPMSTCNLLVLTVVAMSQAMRFGHQMFVTRVIYNVFSKNELSGRKQIIFTFLIPIRHVKKAFGWRI